MNRVLVLFIMTALGTATGYLISKRYKATAEYLDGALSLIGELKRNIAYRRDSVPSILGCATIKSALLKRHTDEYLSYIRGETQELTLTRGSLSQKVYDAACELFRSLGESDGGGQLDKLSMLETKLGELSQAAANDSKKYGGLAIKLGFLGGLAVGVLFL